MILQSLTKTLGQSVYNQIKTAIINSEFRPGQRLYEKEMARIFDVSITPVREAFLRLQADEYITIDSHRKAAVKPITLQEMKEIFEVLANLDAMAAGLVVNIIDSEHILEIENLLDRMEKASKPCFATDYLSLSMEMQHKIWESLPNKILWKALHFAYDQLLRYNYVLYIAFQDPEILRKSFEEHVNIVQTLKNKDKQRLPQLVKIHWNQAIQNLQLKNKNRHAFGANTDSDAGL